MSTPMLGVWECRFITPQIAEKMLSNMIRNRPVGMKRVRMYADAMKHGDWKLTHQGIALRNGVLEDGQHRLHAIIYSGVGVWLWCYSYPTEVESAVHEYDRGASRTDAHVAAIAGLNVTSHIAGYIRVIYFGRRMFEGCVPMDAAEWVRVCEKAMPTVNWLLDNGMRKHTTGMAVAPISGAIGRAKFHVAEDRLLRFLEVYNTGIPGGAHESAALRLREAALQQAGMDSRTRRRDMYLKTAKAINAFVKGQEIKRLHVQESPEEPFPVTW